MADVEYFEEPRPAGAPGGFGIAQWIGAACSLALVIGMIVWAVQLTMRNVADVPVIQALDGPMRVRPDDPGGTQASYQGYSVNRIKAGEAAAPAADRIVLAPAPVSLERPAAPTDVTPAPTLDLNSGDLAALLENAEPLAPLEPLDTPAAQIEQPTETEVLDQQAAGLVRSARPRARPANLRRPAQPIIPQVAVASSAVDLSADTIPAGTRLVQLGAFDDPEIAKREWDRLSLRFGDYMQGKQRVVQRARSGGRDFYRLRVAGFGDANDARRFCAAFLAQNAACIPVTAR